MNKKIISLVFAVLAVILVGGIMVMQSRSSSAAASAVTPLTGDAATPGQMYTTADVATHADQTSCWTIIDDKVYDLTRWIPQHPGGEGAILSLCGHDGSAAFHGQHGYAARQEQILATFFIGTLSQ